MKKCFKASYILLIMLFVLVACFPIVKNESVYASYIDDYFVKPDPVVGDFINNLVMINFQGEENSLYGFDDLVETYDQMYNKSEHSLNAFYKQLSNNKLNLSSSFLTDNGEDFKLITLPKNREYFMNYSFYD